MLKIDWYPRRVRWPWLPASALVGLAGLLVVVIGLSSSRTGVEKPAEATRPATATSLFYVDGSTRRIDQLIGDVDAVTKQPTLDQTFSRYGILGTDLGNSFEHDGKVYFLFGDTLGPDEGDSVGVSSSTDPNAPLHIDMLTGADGRYLKVQPDGIAMGAFDVPVGGIDVDGTMYVAVKTDHTVGATTDRTVLTRYDDTTQTFQPLRELSHLPDGHFITMTFRMAPAGLSGLPTNEPYVLIFGSGQYRRSDLFLAAVPSHTFASGAGTVYFAGMGPDGPLWSDTESDATAVVSHPTIGDVSVSYVAQLGLWVTMYDSRSPRGIVLRYASEPWGPWSAPEVIFDLQKDAGLKAFVHDPRAAADDGLDGPVIGGIDPFKTAGGVYAPYIIERFTQVDGDRLTLQYVLSTWNPYTVVRMQTTLSIQR